MTWIEKTHIPEPYATKVRNRILASIKEVNGCWEWQKSLMVRGGYAQMMLSLEPKKPALYTGHRASWLVFRGDVEPGLHIDHLCRNRKCVNPDHLEPVTPHENILRGEVSREGLRVTSPLRHCSHGHEMTGENIYVYSNRGTPKILCNTCRTIGNRKRNVRNIGTVPSGAKLLQC